MLFLGLNVKLSLNWTQINNPFIHLLTNHKSSIDNLNSQIPARPFQPFWQKGLFYLIASNFML